MFLWAACACSRGEPPSERTTAAAPSPADEMTPAYGDWLVQWLLADPESLNPLTSNDVASSQVLSNIETQLLTLHPETLKPIPVVATDLPVVAEDHLTYTFHVRNDVTFSDGKPLTAEDILFSLKAIKDPEVDAAAMRNYYDSVIDARALDPYTVEFRCREPYFRNDTVLGQMPILPRHFYDSDGLLEGISAAELARWDSLGPEKKARAVQFAERFNRDFHRRVLGAGGYVLDHPGRDLITGERVVLRRRRDFWAPGDSLRGDGWVDRIFFRVINNPDAALVALKASTLDLMSLNPLQHLKQTGTPGFRDRFEKVIAYSPTYSYIGWNETRPIFRDKKVRQALAHFIDRDRIIEKVLFGFGEKVNSSVYLFRPEYNKNLTGYAFDPAEGRRKLADAGWRDSNGDGVLDKTIDGKPTPLRFEIIFNSGNQIRKNVGLIVIDEMKRAGVAASLREVDWSILLEKVEHFDYDAVILGWAFSAGDTDLYQIWHSSQAVPGGSNHVAFKNAEADRILEQYRREFDEGERIRLYMHLQEIIEEEAPYAFLYIPKGISAYDRRYRNTRWYPTGGPNLNEWWVPLALQRYGK